MQRPKERVSFRSVQKPVFRSQERHPGEGRSRGWTRHPSFSATECILDGLDCLGERRFEKQGIGGRKKQCVLLLTSSSSLLSCTACRRLCRSARPTELTPAAIENLSSPSLHPSRCGLRVACRRTPLVT